jgi:acetoin utilization deacetylase AcuC-like enzyme
VGKLAPAGRLSSEDFHDFVARIRNLANRHCLGRMVGVMEGGYCCRPAEALVEEMVGGGSGSGEESDQDCLGDDVKDETIQHCVAATCRALAGL